jgi:hypothetical protein
MAQQIADPAAKRHMQDIAANCEKVAKRVEAKLGGEQSFTATATGTVGGSRVIPFPDAHSSRTNPTSPPAAVHGPWKSATSWRRPIMPLGQARRFCEAATSQVLLVS